MTRIFLTLLATICIASCVSNNQTDITQKRNNEIDVADFIEEFSLGDALIGSDVAIGVTDDHLFLTDFKSVDKIVAAFSVRDGKYIGSFGNFGPGPYDIGIPGQINVYVDDVDGREKGIIFNFAQNSVLRFDIDSALYTLDYLPTRMKHLGSKEFPDYYKHINDTLGFAQKIILGPDGNGFSQSIGRYNLSSGELTDFAPEEAIEGNYSSFAISPERDMLVEVGQRVDIIKIYDLDGNVKKRIKGPDFRPEPKGGKAYFSDVCFTDKYILCVYSGEKWNGGSLGKKIVVLDLEGNYLATLDTGRKIRNIEYHAPSEMLYISFPNDEIQVGKLNLDAMLKGKTKKIAQEQKAIKRNEDSNLCSVRFLSAKDMAALESLQADTVEIYEGFGTSCPPNTKIIPRYVQQTGMPDTLWIKSIKSSPEFLRLNLLVKYLTPGMVTVGEICFEESAPDGQFEGEIELTFDNPETVATLPISGYIKHVKME